VHGEVEPEPVELALTAGDPRGEVVGVLGRGLHVGVDQPAVLVVVAPSTFQTGELLLQPVRGGDRVDRLHVHRDVQTAGVGE
jgi:hypothetical protein